MVEKDNDKHLCPCCGKYIFEEYHTYDICDICNWMDDPIQNERPNYEGGGNKMSLNQAKEAFKNGIQVR